MWHVTRCFYYYWIPMRCKIFCGILHRDLIKLWSHWRGVLLNFISYFSLTNLDCPPPDGLHRQRDEAGDRVRQGQVVDKVMDIGADPGVSMPYIIYDENLTTLLSQCQNLLVPTLTLRGAFQFLNVFNALPLPWLEAFKYKSVTSLELSGDLLTERRAQPFIGKSSYV